MQMLSKDLGIQSCVAQNALDAQEKPDCRGFPDIFIAFYMESFDEACDPWKFRSVASTIKGEDVPGKRAEGKIIQIDVIVIRPK